MIYNTAIVFFVTAVVIMVLVGTVSSRASRIWQLMVTSGVSCTPISLRTHEYSHATPALSRYPNCETNTVGDSSGLACDAGADAYTASSGKPLVRTDCCSSMFSAH